MLRIMFRMECSEDYANAENTVLNEEITRKRGWSRRFGGGVSSQLPLRACDTC